MIKGGWNPGCFVVAVGTGCGEAHGLVWRIVGGVVITLVTTNACSWRVAGEVAVAGHTTDGCMRAIQRPYTAVIKSGRYPGCLVVTHGTVGREPGSFVIWIGGGIIIVLVTSHTGIRCIVVVTIVAGRTIIGNVGMSPNQRIIVIVYGECRGHPVRIGCMAHVAIGRNIQRQVVRIDTLVVVGLVTGHTGVRQIAVIALMTGIAVNCKVLTCKRPHGTVIESGGYPGILIVTVNTRCRELLLQVIRIYCLVIVVSVTARTGVWRIIVVALVTVIAGNTRMRTHDGVERVVQR